jgi:Transposase
MAGYWAADALAAAGAEVHLAHPLGVKGFAYRRVKNDELDARDLADLLRMGRLPEAWIAPAEIRELREITRYRAKLVGTRTSGKDQVHGVLAKLGIPVTCSDIFGVAGSAWLDELPLPQPYGGKVASCDGPPGRPGGGGRDPDNRSRGRRSHHRRASGPSESVLLSVGNGAGAPGGPPKAEPGAGSAGRGAEGAPLYGHLVDGNLWQAARLVGDTSGTFKPLETPIENADEQKPR